MKCLYYCFRCKTARYGCDSEKWKYCPFCGFKAFSGKEQARKFHRLRYHDEKRCSCGGCRDKKHKRMKEADIAR